MRYDKSVAQIYLRWLLQKEIVSLPKSSSENRIVENIRIFDFELNESDMNIIDNLPAWGGFSGDSDIFFFFFWCVQPTEG